MSLITILAKSPHIIGWESISSEIASLGLSEIEVFPIPMELGFEQNALGVSVHRKFKNKEALLTEMYKLFKYLISMDFELTELYSGKLVNEQNMRSIVLPLLTP